MWKGASLDKSAYKAIEEAYHKKRGDMLKLAKTMLPKEDAEDAVQNAFLRCLKMRQNTLI